MAITLSKRHVALILICGLTIPAILGFSALFPVKPDLSEVPNPVNDHSSEDWSEKEATLTLNPNKNVYFGDLHVHTSFSFDAYLGGTISSPSDAYRYARGKPIQIFGKPIKIDRPLDFSAVTDHSELIGELYTIQNEGSPGYNSFVPRFFRGVYNDRKEYGVNTKRQRNIFNIVLKRASKGAPKHPGFFQGYTTTRSSWDIILKAAETPLSARYLYPLWPALSGHSYREKHIYIGT